MESSSTQALETSWIRAQAWRFAFLLSGAAMLAGGPQHPSPDLTKSFEDSTATMLADPGWVPAHLGILASYLLLLTALWLWARRAQPGGRLRAWTRFAMLAVALGVVEMAFHTASVLDVERLRAGEATPILTAHLVLAATVNPVLAIGVAGLAVVAAWGRRLGSRWIAWVPVVGGALYGAASPYVVLTHDQRVSPLFAIGTALLALWFVLVALWPVRGEKTEV